MGGNPRFDKNVTSEDLDSGYLYAFLSTEYGYQQAIKFKYGAVIDHLTPEQIENFIPIPTKATKRNYDLLQSL